MSGVAARQSPPLDSVLPFFLTAPLGLIAAGLMLAVSETDVFLAVNVPSLMAATHAAVLGWLTLSIMGALYQLGPAVFGGRLLSVRLIRMQFVIHALSVAVFVGAVAGWQVSTMGAAAIGLSLSFAIFLVNALPAVLSSRKGSLPRTFILVALGFLVMTAAVGVSFVGSFEHAWFPVTQARLAGHAHLGLVGWVALTLMGVSYQLVPMFHVVPRKPPRFGHLVLITSSFGAAAAAIGFIFDPPWAVRLVLAAVLASGFLLWASDIVEFLRTRSRRTMDIHGRSTVLSLGFLFIAIALGLLVSIGEPVAPAGEPARLQLAYGVAAIGGWAGVTLIGNSFKIVPFLVWNARYRQLAGLEPVPMVAELVSDWLAHLTLVVHATAVLVLVVGALVGSLLLLHAGGVLLMLAGAAHCGGLAFVVIHHPARLSQMNSPSGLARL